jgi:hypothetical protein
MAKKREGLKKKENKSHLWEIVDDILVHKTGMLLDNPEYEKSFSPFMTVRVLSMNPNLMGYASYVNSLQQTFGGHGLDKKRFYKMLVNIIPVTNTRVAYLKSSSQEDTNVASVMQYFDCNQREALMYIEQYGEKWVDSINRTQGGIRDE